MVDDPATPPPASAAGSSPPSSPFVLILLGAKRFGRLRGNPYARAFLDGAGPIGAIVGVALPLKLALSEDWQLALLAGAALLLLVRRGVVLTLCSGEEPASSPRSRERRSPAERRARGDSSTRS